jgi:hypothetical protein
MSSDSTPVSVLRALAARQGVEPTDDDLEAVQAFLDTILPRLAEVERSLPPGTAPAERVRP